LVLLFLLLTVALYIPVVTYDFVWDDFLMIVQNQYFKDARYIPLYFTSDFGHLTSGGLAVMYYRPLFAMSFLMDFTLWGNNPAGFHLTNLLLYVIAVWLVYRLSRCLFVDVRVSLSAALVFALYPVHVEPVAFVSARPDVMAALGMLLAFLSYHRFRHGAGQCRWLALTGSILGFGFGLLAKEMAISLPAILVWYEIVLCRRGGEPDTKMTWSRLLPVTPHLLVGLGFLWLRWPAVRALAPAGLSPAVLWERLPGTLEVLGRYVSLAVWPFLMQPAYIHPRPESLWHPWPLTGLGIIVLSGASLAAWWHRQPRAAFAVGWVFLTLAPAADLVPLGQRIANLLSANMADRYFFIPSLGICWLLALGGIHLWDKARLQSRRWAVAFAIVSGGVLGVWIGSVLAYTPIYRDSLSLSARDVRDNPQYSPGYGNLGLALVRAGRIDEAIRALETAVRLDPGDVRAQLALARTYVEHGRASDGFRILDRLGPWPGHEKMYFLVRARAHMAMEEWDSAYRVLSYGLQRFPELAEGYQALGFILEKQGRMEEAMDAYRRAFDLRPDLFWAYLGLARIQLQLGDARQAASTARAAVRSDANVAAAWRILALALEEIGDSSGSRQAWKQVLELDDAPESVTEASRHLFSLDAPAGEQPRDHRR
jgi:tetratricopeptide (TPR) repeat protein